MKENFDSPVTQEHSALEVGTNVSIHNTRNSAKSRQDKTELVVQKLLLRQYCIKITVLLGSGYIVEHNHKFIKEIPLSSNHSIIPSPLHNHPETQNGPDIQSEYISKEIPN